MICGGKRIADCESWKLGMLEVVLSIVRQFLSNVKEARNPLHLEASSTRIVLRTRPLASVASIPEMTVRHGKLGRWRRFARF